MHLSQKYFSAAYMLPDAVKNFRDNETSAATDAANTESWLELSLEKHVFNLQSFHLRDERRHNHAKRLQDEFGQIAAHNDIRQRISEDQAQRKNYVEFAWQVVESHVAEGAEVRLSVGRKWDGAAQDRLRSDTADETLSGKSLKEITNLRNNLTRSTEFQRARFETALGIYGHNHKFSNRERDHQHALERARNRTEQPFRSAERKDRAHRAATVKRERDAEISRLRELEQTAGADRAKARRQRQTLESLRGPENEIISFDADGNRLPPPIIEDA